MRQRVQEETEKALKQVTVASLDAYLDGLAARAQHKGMVTASEVEPGLIVIRTLTQDMKREATFVTRMETLSQQLTPQKPGADQPILDPETDH